MLGGMRAEHLFVFADVLGAAARRGA
jgi:hypothetical protein